MPFELFKPGGSSVQLDDVTQVMEYLGQVEIPPSAWPAARPTGPDGNSHYYTTTSISLPASVQMLCVSNTSGAPLALNKTVLNGSQRTYVFSSTTQPRVVLHMYGPRSITPGNFGFQLFNGIGELTFDATSKFLRVSSVITPTADNQVINLPQSAGVQAVALGNHQTYIRGASVGQRPAFIVVRRAIIVSASQVTMATVTQHGPPYDQVPKPTPVPPMPPMLIASVGYY